MPPSDEETPGQNEIVNDGGHFSDSPRGDKGANAVDYTRMSWEQIMVSLWGYGGLTGSAIDSQVERAAGNVDPMSLKNAGDTYFRTQEILIGVRDGLNDWTDALAGTTGSWQGPAALAFRDKMTDLHNHIDAHVKALGGGISGLVPQIPMQMYTLANNLHWAREEAKRIVDWYGQWAVVNRHVPVKNGAVLLNEDPEVAAAVTEALRTVMDRLTPTYQIQILEPEVPAPVTSTPDLPDTPDNPGGGGGPDTTGGGPDTTGGNKTPVPDVDVPDGPTTGGGGGGGGGAGTPKPEVPDIDVPDGPTAGGGGGGGTPTPDVPDIDVPGGPTTGGGGSGLPGFGTGTGTGGGTGTGAGSPGGLPTVPGITVPGLPGGIGGGVPGLSNGGKGTTVPGLSSGGKPGAAAGGGAGGVGDLPAGSGVDDIAPPTVPGGASLVGDLPAGLAGGTGSGTAGGANSGMPPMTPMSPPAGAGSGPDRSDASGLVNAGVEPWQVSDGGGGVPDAPGGATPGAAAAGGQQQMPPMSPMSPPAGADGGPERSDASGLVNAGVEPWEPVETPSGAPAAPFGAQPVQQQQMPPMAPATPAPATAGGPERSDAADLISDGVEQWEPATSTTEGPYAPAGAAPVQQVTAPAPAAPAATAPADGQEWTPPTLSAGEEAWLVPGGAAPMAPAVTAPVAPAAAPPTAPVLPTASAPSPALAPPTAPGAGPASAPATGGPAATAAPGPAAQPSAGPAAPGQATSPASAAGSAAGTQASGTSAPAGVAGGNAAPGDASVKDRAEIQPPPAVLLPAFAVSLPMDKGRERNGRPGDEPGKGDVVPDDELAGDTPDGPADADPDGPDDYVPVIKDDGDDHDSWEDGDLSWAADAGLDDDKPDGPDWGDLGWQADRAESTGGDPATPPHLAAWRPRRTEPSAIVVDHEPEAPQVLTVSSQRLTDEERAAYWAEREAAKEAQRKAEEPVEEPTGDEKPAERRSLDLLKQDHDAWFGGREEPGVIG